MQLVKFRKKLREGVSFVQTQAVYDMDELRSFMGYVRSVDGKAKILAGIVPVISARMAEYMNENVPGIFVPEEMIEELRKTPKGEGVNKGIQIAARLIRQIRDERLCDGVHIMFIGREQRVPEILEAAGL